MIMSNQLLEIWTGDMNGSNVEIELVLTRLPVNSLWSSHWRIIQLDGHGDPRPPQELLYKIGDKSAMLQLNHALLEQLGFTLQARPHEDA